MSVISEVTLHKVCYMENASDQLVHFLFRESHVIANFAQIFEPLSYYMKNPALKHIWKK